MYNKSKIFISIFTTLIVLSFLISFAYGISYNPKINEDSSIICIKKSFYIISTILIILLTLFNFYVLFSKHDRTYKMIV
jgi:hypothetical protein